MTRRVRLTIFALVLAAALWLDPIWAPLAPVGLFMPVFAPPECTIFEDDFSTDRTGTDYTVVSGTWSVGSGVLTTSSAGALLVANTAGTTGRGRVQVTAKASTTGASFRLIGSYVDDDNYVFAEVTVNGGSSTYRLWKREASVDTELESLSTTLSTNTNITATLCWDGTYAFASFTATIAALSGAYTGTGNVVGLGASANGGTVTFDNLEFTVHADDNADCPACGVPCSNCETATTPSAVKVTISGLTNGNCAQCTSINGSYILDQKYGACQYHYEELLPCGYFNIRLFIDVNYWELDISNELVYWELAKTNPADCRFGVLTGFTPGPFNSDVTCQWSNATVSVEAL